MIVIPVSPMPIQHHYAMNPSPLTGFMMGAAMSSGNIDPTTLIMVQNMIELSEDKKRIINVKLLSPSTDNGKEDSIITAKRKTILVLAKMYNESNDEQERNIIYKTIEKIITN